MTLEQFSSHDFHCTQEKRNLLAGMFSALNTAGDFLQVVTSSQILREERVCETMGPLQVLSKMHEAEVPDSLLCLGKRTMNEPEIKFLRWDVCLEQYKETASRTDGAKVQFVFHFFLVPKRTRRFSESMNGFDKFNEMDKFLIQKPVLIEFFSWE